MSDSPNIDKVFQLFGQLLERTDGTGTDAQLLERLRAEAPLVRELASLCDQTPLFLRAADKFVAFRTELDAEYPPEDRLRAAWLHCLDRVCSAPTTLAGRLSVFFTVPLVALYLPESSQ
jgi:hypothetical protein